MTFYFGKVLFVANPGYLIGANPVIMMISLTIWCKPRIPMKFFALEHSPVAYAADFVVYPATILAGFFAVLFHTPIGRWPTLALALVLGLMAWSLIEYVLHRHILHGLQPFKRWHDEHHKRPFALIGTSTVGSLLLIAALVFAPLFLSFDVWLALAATLGVMCGYLFYDVMHHASHHWRAKSGGWFQSRKRAHALHHQPGANVYYGVTTSFWDWVFATRPKNG
jgi:hypothetical protein